MTDLEHQKLMWDGFPIWLTSVVRNQLLGIDKKMLEKNELIFYKMGNMMCDNIIQYKYGNKWCHSSGVTQG